jgi:hypothetical protein
MKFLIVFKYFEYDKGLLASKLFLLNWFGKPVLHFNGPWWEKKQQAVVMSTVPVVIVRCRFTEKRELYIGHGKHIWGATNPK